MLILLGWTIMVSKVPGGSGDLSLFLSLSWCWWSWPPSIFRMVEVDICQGTPPSRTHPTTTAFHSLRFIQRKNKQTNIWRELPDPGGSWWPPVLIRVIQSEKHCLFTVGDHTGESIGKHHPPHPHLSSPLLPSF